MSDIKIAHHNQITSLKVLKRAWSTLVYKNWFNFSDLLKSFESVTFITNSESHEHKLSIEWIVHK